MNILLIVEAKILVLIKFSCSSLNVVDYRYLLAEFGQPSMDSEFSEFLTTACLPILLRHCHFLVTLPNKGKHLAWIYNHVESILGSLSSWGYPSIKNYIW